MTQLDARKRAEALRAARGELQPARLAALAALGIDANLTLAEIDPIEAADADPGADEDQVRALRQLPLGLWTAPEIYLVLIYERRGGEPLALALETLRQAPLQEAMWHPGDLLVAAAQAAAAGMVLPDGSAGTAAVAGLLPLAAVALRAYFEGMAGAIGLDEVQALLAWETLIAGDPVAADARFETAAALCGRLAQARELVAPLPLLQQAEAEIVYSNYRHRLQPMSPADLATPGMQALLALPGTHCYSRLTSFRIVADGPAVRLQHLAKNAIENWHGVRFADVAAAEAHAERAFGVARDAWMPAAVGDR